MIIDARTLTGDPTLEADVCVIGGGAAGITLARELSAAQLDIVVLESGGFEYEEATQSLYDGPVSGDLLAPEANYLKASRLRFLGGSTNHWAGWCRPLDPLDFEPREWIPLSGWPFTRASLEPYYARACAYLQIAPFGADAIEHSNPDSRLFTPDSPIQTSFFHISPPTRFGEVYGKEMTDSSRIRLCTWANVVEMETNPAGTLCARVRAATLSGATFSVRARVVVVAAGGIDSARLLLCSNRVHQNGLGNQGDMVGRCFMEHPTFQPVGWVAIHGRRGGLKPYTVRRLSEASRVQGMLFTSAETQRELRLTNVLFSLRDKGPSPELADEVSELALAVDHFTGNLEPPLGDQTYLATVSIVSEQVPNRDSRVLLTEERDALGLPRARLDWRLCEIDQRSMRDSIELLARELGRNKLGRGAFLIDKDKPWERVATSAHHMGTTRMSTDPMLGVVDPTLRVHGIDNLYVASSAVFPTSGVSNPTLTIVALTVRLADHLKGKLA